MNKLEIYIHIPFCVKKCDYCDFLSEAVDDKTKDKYVHKLIKEIELSKPLMEGYEVTTLFFGGGTPSILKPEQLVEIIECLKKNINLSQNYEMTVECNPGTLTEEKLKAYKQAGVNRLSIGLQSADDLELKSVGRIHTWKEFVDNYECARKVGFGNINIDLMSSLPGQSIETYETTLDKVIKLNPEHISAYSLIVEEGTNLFDRVEAAKEQGIDILPDEDTEREMYYLTQRKLQEHGYHRYEISNYSKEGFECRHNVGYWKRKEYLGFGIGSASLYKNCRYTNTSNLQKYLEFDDLDQLRENREILSKTEQMEEFMFLGLRMMDGISTKEFNQLFGEKFDDVYGEISNKLEKEKMISKDKEFVKLTKRGIDVSNTVMAEFLLDS